MPPTKKAKLRSQLLWLFLLPIPLLWCLLSHAGALTFLENKTIDWRFQARGELDAPVKVVYVDVGSLSLGEIGGWPWNRTYFERMASALIDAGHARAVGFDFVFSDEGVSESVDLRKLVEGNRVFGRYLFRGPPVVLAAAYGGRTFVDKNGYARRRELPLVAGDARASAERDPPELPEFRRSLTQKVFYTPPDVGLIDTLDDGTRVVPAWAPTATRPYFHLSLELARLYWGLPPGSIRVNGTNINFVRPDGSIQATVPLHRRQFVDVNWFTHWRSPRDKHFEFARVYAYADALVEGDPGAQQIARQFFDRAGFKDAIVLVGPSDPLFQDIAPTSLDPAPVPKVSVYGNLLKTVITGKYLRWLPRWHGIAWADYALVFALTLAVTALALFSGTRGWQAVAARTFAVLVLAGYVVLAFAVFKAGNLILPLTAPIGAAFTTSFAGLVWQVIAEQKAKGRIKGMFGTYVAPSVVEQMVESGRDPELGGHDAEITAYFSDIQGFSSFSELLPSSRLGELLNEYLTACTDLVQAETGTLDKYIGDAVVAMFGAPVDAPDHAYRACLASQLVQRRLAALRDRWRAEGDKWPPQVHALRTRIGLNTGVCMIGNMGSRTRFNYTMMGDNVNLAARMESGAKSWGVYTMCTDSTRLACRAHDADRIVFRALGRIVVKGRTQPVPIHEIVGLKEDLTEQTRECIDLFERGLAKYHARDWAAAQTLFAHSCPLEPNQPDLANGITSNPSLVYLTRIIPEARAEPLPSDWDGRYVMREK